MIAELVKKRKLLGLTQAELARSFGISQPMLAMIEAGRKLLPASLAPLVRRWLRSDTLPSADELAKRQKNPGR